MKQDGVGTTYQKTDGIAERWCVEGEQFERPLHQAQPIRSRHLPRLSQPVFLHNNVPYIICWTKKTARITSCPLIWNKKTRML